MISRSPSKVSLPQANPGVTTVLEYLVQRFPAISRAIWQQRMLAGKVHWHDGSLINADTPYAAQQRVYYYREVAEEPVIPFVEKILYQDASILVAFKPHFLPVTSGGRFVEECLQSRLRNKTGNLQLQALHRLDSATAGLVMFSKDPKTSRHYHDLFARRQIHKTYQAVARANGNSAAVNQEWEVKNRIQKCATGFLMQVVEGTPNSHTRLRCLQRMGDSALFELHPITGKTHQLRVHMQGLGWPIVNDLYYPEAVAAPERSDFSRPLQLLAQRLEFIDPLNGNLRKIDCGVELIL